MAGTLTVTRIPKVSTQGSQFEKVAVEWTSDASGNADVQLVLFGFLIKVVTKPSATAPTTLYDITLTDPDDSAFDVLGAALANRSATATEQVYPVITGAATPVLVSGLYTFKVANAGNAKAGTVWLYLVESL